MLDLCDLQKGMLFLDAVSYDGITKKLVEFNTAMLADEVYWCNLCTWNSLCNKILHWGTWKEGIVFASATIWPIFESGASLRPHIWCCGYILRTIKYQDCEFRFEIGNWQLDICAGTEGFSIKSGWHSPDTGYSCNLERHVWLSHILLCWCWFQANHEPATTMASTVYISRYTLANSFKLLINFK